MLRSPGRHVFILLGRLGGRGVRFYWNIERRAKVAWEVRRSGGGPKGK